jgi:hypothetical protein
MMGARSDSSADASVIGFTSRCIRASMGGSSLRLIASKSKRLQNEVVIFRQSG